MTKEEVYAIIEDHYRDNFDSLVKKITGSAKSRHNAEDIIQEAYCRACQYWKSFKGDLEFNNWFTSILNNSTRDFMRNESMQGMVMDEWSGEIVDPVAFQRIELSEMLDLIQRQPARVSRILEYYLLDEMSVKEISQVVPESPSNIRKIVQRFREEARV